MRVVPLLIGLAACTGPDAEPVRNGLRAELVLLSAGADEGRIEFNSGRFEQLQFGVSDLAFDAGGTHISNGAVAIHDFVGDGRLQLPPLELQTGIYTDAATIVTLGMVGDEFALELQGTVGGVDFRLESPDALVLRAPSEELELLDGIDYTVRWYVQPSAWFEGVDLGPGDDDEVFLSPDANADLYQQVLDRIGSTTIPVYPGEVPPQRDDEPPFEPDTGTGTGEFLVVARVEHAGDEVVANVELEDAAGTEVTGATVKIGGVALTEQEPGTYEGDLPGGLVGYALSVEHSTGDFSAAVASLADPNLEIGSAPIDVGQPWLMTWTPDGADEVRIRTENLSLDLSDAGAVAIGVGEAEYALGVTGEESVRFERDRTVALSAALPESVFELTVRIELEDIDTFDSRVGSISGTTESDTLTGETLVVLAWPEAVSDSDPPWMHLTVEESDASADWSFDTDVWPGDWRLVVYVDEDDSDSGLSVPLGPDLDELTVELDVTVEPGEDADISHTLD